MEYFDYIHAGILILILAKLESKDRPLSSLLTAIIALIFFIMAIFTK